MVLPLATMPPSVRPGPPQPHAGSSSLGIDELDAGRLERAADGLVIGPSELGLACGELGATDGGDADGGGAGELLGAPANERTGGPDLGAGERLRQRHADGVLRLLQGLVLARSSGEWIACLCRRGYRHAAPDGSGADLATNAAPRWPPR